MNKQTLRPCPFCGGFSAIYSNTVELFVECEKCGVRREVSIIKFAMPDEIEIAKDRAKAALVAEWNQRENE